MEMNAASKMKLEKRMINLSFIGSVLFVLAEGIMAYQPLPCNTDGLRF